MKGLRSVLGLSVTCPMLVGFADDDDDVNGSVFFVFLFVKQPVQMFFKFPLTPPLSLRSLTNFRIELHLFFFSTSLFLNRF